MIDEILGTEEGKITESPRLLIVDDDSAMRDMLRVSLENEWNIVGEAENGLTAIQASEELRPDVVLLDVSMPVMNGFTAVRRLKEARPGVRIIFVTQHIEAAYMAEAFRLGADGYVLKGSAVRDLTTAIREVLAGRSFPSRSASREP